jgi:hypothetical protein
MPLPIPSRKWESVGLDFIFGLPRTASGFDGIMTAVCRLTKRLHLSVVRSTDDAPESAEVFFRDVVRLHGVPSSIVSDRDVRFTSRFWRALWKRLGTKLAMSTAFHPQTDGQTERANRTLEEMLRAYVDYHQTDWDKHLVAVEIACNNAVQASTGVSAFLLDCGQEFSLPISQLDVSAAVPSANPAASEMIDRMRASVELAKEQLQKAQERQKQYADKSRRELVFKVGDRVMLSSDRLNPNGRAHKLISPFFGPFAISKVISPVAYQLILPPSFHRIHPVFHVSRLRPFVDGSSLFPSRPSDPLFRPPPAEVLPSGEEQWEVERIVDRRERRVGRGRRVLVEYLVLWKGFPDWERTWEPVSHLRGAMDAVSAYEADVRNGRARGRPAR